MFVICVENPAGWGGGGGGPDVIKKWKIQGGGGGGGTRKIPSMVGVWIFSGTTHLKFPFFIM